MSPISEKGDLAFLSDPGTIPKLPNLLDFTGEVPRKVQLPEKVKLSPLLSRAQRDGRRDERAESVILTKRFAGPKSENVKEEHVFTDNKISSDDYLVNRTNKYSPSKSKALLNQIASKIGDGITVEEIKNILGSDSEGLQEGDVLEIKQVDTAVDNRDNSEFQSEY